MKPLIAIVTCHKFHARANAQRETWIKDLMSMPKEHRIDYKFFLGRGSHGRPEMGDEVYLDVNDSYEQLPYKVREIMKWSVRNGYDAVLKVDDDTYVFPERTHPPVVPYSGRLNKSLFSTCPMGWCSGFAYWLVEPAVSLIASAPNPDLKAEDVWVGRTLGNSKIRCVNNPHMQILSVVPKHRWIDFHREAQAACEFRDEKMIEFHNIIRGIVEPERQPVPPIKHHQFGRIIRKA